MCHPDTSLMTFMWEEKHERPMLQLEGPTHTCWNWEELNAKMRPRMIQDEEMRRMVNPLMIS